MRPLWMSQSAHQLASPLSAASLEAARRKMFKDVEAACKSQTSSRAASPRPDRASHDWASHDRAMGRQFSILTAAETLSTSKLDAKAVLDARAELTRASPREASHDRAMGRQFSILTAAETLSTSVLDSKAVLGARADMLTRASPRAVPASAVRATGRQFSILTAAEAVEETRRNDLHVQSTSLGRSASESALTLSGESAKKGDVTQERDAAVQRKQRAAARLAVCAAEDERIAQLRHLQASVRAHVHARMRRQGSGSGRHSVAGHRGAATPMWR